MPAVLPFRGLRYAAARARGLSPLIAPPYDVVSAAQRDELAARSPNNIIHLLLDKELPGDGPEENRYLRASRSLEEWIAAGVLRHDASPAVYGLEQSFTGPDGRPCFRIGATVAMRLHAYGEGPVLPHEKTLAAPRLDRLEILKAVKANLSSIFGLFEDPRRDGYQAIQALVMGDPVAEADSDDGVHHRIFRVEDPAAIARLQAVMSDRKVFIADGHHRYEAALAYRNLFDREHPGLPDNAGHRYLLANLCSMADPGLCIYPTHRLVFGLRDFRLAPFLEALGRYFEVETLNEDMSRAAGRAWAISKLAEHAGKSTTFLLVSGEDRRGRVLTLRDDIDLAGVPLPASQVLRDLDVSALHAIVLQHLLGISPEAQERQENVRYEMDAGAAVSRVLSGEVPLGFLVNPTPIWQVQAVAEGEETMPQKSTFFFPKLASGLVMRKVHEDLPAS
ncbi:MAG: DUF1015 domain-containing protein [Deltaproteobacteria bacterium]|nr:DUF1015 domain-containing protein [Deltaproteobacteria bacterium]